LRLGGLDGVEGLNKELAAAEQAADQPLVWPALAAKLREALTDKLRQQHGKEGLAGRDRLSGIAHPFDRLATGDRAEGRPGAHLVERDAVEAWRWCWDRLDYERCELAALGEGRPFDKEVEGVYTLLRDRCGQRLGDQRPRALAVSWSDLTEQPMRLTSGAP